MGMYPVEKGEIKIGGTDINEISRENMNKIICVFQNFMKHSGSVEENITLGDGEATVKEPVIKALGLESLLKDNIELGQLDELGAELSGRPMAEISNM